jgi:hypothetical protein
MKTFTDAAGRTWQPLVREEPGTDYKGRFVMVLRPVDGAGEEYPLEDIRWNTDRTARRTLETMSGFEFRRRLRLAVGRGRRPIPSFSDL